jgi:8-oxo-dGTP diphosphatase
VIQVAAAIIYKDHKILICQRGAGGHCEYLWEFPGGKQDVGETLEQCLVRECREELGIEIEVKSIFAETVYQYPDRKIAFTFFNAELIQGEPVKSVHRDIKWVSLGELANYKFCPADVGVVDKLANAFLAMRMR